MMYRNFGNWNSGWYDGWYDTMPTWMMNSWGLSAPFGIMMILGIALFALKGYTLWHAARKNDQWWFIALLVLNTLGILELIYLVKRGIIGKKI